MFHLSTQIAYSLTNRGRRWPKNEHLILVDKKAAAKSRLDAKVMVVFLPPHVRQITPQCTREAKLLVNLKYIPKRLTRFLMALPLPLLLSHGRHLDALCCIVICSTCESCLTNVTNCRHSNPRISQAGFCAIGAPGKGV